MASTTPETAPTPVGVRDLLEAGLHFGHQTKRWNPKMKRYIFDKRNGIHIIDLSKSLVLLEESLQFLHDVVARGQSVLFVGTKKQAQKIIKETAAECGQHYVTHRWLGGTLTNNVTIRKGVKRMREIEAVLGDEGKAPSSKKELAKLNREFTKLNRNLSGVADMDKMPGAMLIVDINREAIAVAEANKSNIPVCAIVDTNCNPDPIDYVIPGNDDAIRAIGLICGAAKEQIQKGVAEYAEKAAEAARQKEEERAKAEELKKLQEQRATEAAKEKAEQKKAAQGQSKRDTVTPAKPKSRKTASTAKKKTETAKEPAAATAPAEAATEKPEAAAPEAVAVVTENDEAADKQ